MIIGLEIPAFGSIAAREAVSLGATRIELNAKGSYSKGGLTPSLQDLEDFLSATNGDQRVPVRIMIRPRGPPAENCGSSSSGRDFIYSDSEFEEMQRDIKKFKESGLLDVEYGDGFVFGILIEDDDGTTTTTTTTTTTKTARVDVKRCSILEEAAYPYKCVFHRAFDEIVDSDWERGLGDIAKCRFSGILTSGGPGRAIDNVVTLEKIIDGAMPLNVEIIVGGGVRKGNVVEIMQRLRLRDRGDGLVCLHSACLRAGDDERVEPGEVQGILAQVGSESR
ncbi:hypothetical protein GGS20DRAFT_473451 [Poronia punctata]|nr:hypothetical protein GGS20DRAFT_473451 [Poronia punctata]